MNDYQKAYQRLTSRVYKNDHIEDVYKDLEVLGELVDKATPKMPEEIDRGYGYGYCPVCGHYNEHPANYCHNCGQHLDWSEEEENCDED